MSNPNDLIEEHEKTVTTLTEWANEENLTDEDQAALRELAEEDKAQRETDGYAEIKAEELRKLAAKVAGEESLAQADSDWHLNPEGHNPDSHNE